MSKRIEKLLKDYPQMVQERNCLAHQLAHFRGVTAEEVIESMYTPRQDCERVQTSTLSDKTAQIALEYQNRMERLNREWYGQLEKQLYAVTDEVVFLESALESLSGKLPDIMRDLVVNRLSWNEIAEKHYVSRSMIAKYRKKAIDELDVLYRKRDTNTARFILS